MTSARRSSIGVGFLGCGTVGSSAARILVDHASDLAQRAGAALEVRRIAVRDLSKQRPVSFADDVWTSKATDVTDADDIDIVVEAIGGMEPAQELVLRALRNGKHVVTANKELLSVRGKELMDVAERSGVDILFEAAVGGGIPIIRPLKESLAGDRVRRVMGIVNGTTNFILTRMSETGVDFGDALEEATRLGYAEADPSADIDGFDAASKLAILASIAFNARVLASDVHREGIARVTAEDINAAHDLGYEVKLVAIAERDGDDISARVHPAMLPKTHPLASVRDVFNAIFVESEESGELMFFGRGAGGAPTGSAVVGDIVEIARNIALGGRSPAPAYYRELARIRSQSENPVRYYAVLSVADQPGVLSAVAGAFAAHDVSISSVRQEGSGDEATLVVITHVATEGQHQLTFDELGALDAVKEVASKMRVEGTSER
ncbi:MAG: homoserine dehydrogenase [Actinomycetota bacterium]|jgi:homoserine dehydrogenase|nr:homoserine dehydrogenase [Actinomycetota bacterium]